MLRRLRSSRFSALGQKAPAINCPLPLTSLQTRGEGKVAAKVHATRRNYSLSLGVCGGWCVQARQTTPGNKSYSHPPLFFLQREGQKGSKATRNKYKSYSPPSSGSTTTCDKSCSLDLGFCGAWCVETRHKTPGNSTPPPLAECAAQAVRGRMPGRAVLSLQLRCGQEGGCGEPSTPKKREEGRPHARVFS
mgnify:CR=1 FL=1